MTEGCSKPNKHLQIVKKLFLIPFMFVAVGWCSAARLVRAVSMSGSYYEVSIPVGADHIYIFKDVNDASFETLDGEAAKWTELKTGEVKSNYTMYQSVQDGYCYSVEQNGRRETFVFLDYSKHRLAGIQPQITMGCSSTEIVLPNLKALNYYDSLNVQQTLPYYLFVTYDNQRWGETDWETVSITDSIPYQGPIVLDSILCDTRFMIAEDSISTVLYGEPDTLVTDKLEAVAVAHHQQYFITKRGKTLENEKEGPYENQTIIHSAPLDVLFESHPSAKADVYTWTVKRGDEIRTSRQDKDMRYVFDEASESGPVTYWIELKILNSEHPECMATATDTITLNSSFILVPNVFSPNGDGKNDEFRVAYRSICDFHCWIYNRWQHLIYSWDDPTKGWDGTYNGRKEPDSAYLYIIEATGCDGRKFKIKGMVNLLRGK